MGLVLSPEPGEVLHLVAVIRLSAVDDLGRVESVLRKKSSKLKFIYEELSLGVFEDVVNRYDDEFGGFPGAKWAIEEVAKKIRLTGEKYPVFVNGRTNEVITGFKRLLAYWNADQALVPVIFVF